jgi:hypothetical protein
MLNKEKFFDGMEQLLVFFPNWNVKVENVKVMKAWYSMFEKSTDEEFEAMVKSYIKKEKFQPTVAGLKEHFKKKTMVKITRRDDF